MLRWSISCFNVSLYESSFAVVILNKAREPRLYCFYTYKCGPSPVAISILVPWHRPTADLDLLQVTPLLSGGLIGAFLLLYIFIHVVIFAF